VAGVSFDGRRQLTSEVGHTPERDLDGQSFELIHGQDTPTMPTTIIERLPRAIPKP
jgi:hypothetical protein